MRVSLSKLSAAVSIAVVIALVSAQAAAADPTPQLPVAPVSSYPAAPSPSAAFDWKQRALDYDAFIYNWSQPGSCPTIQTDTLHLHMATNTVKMPTYYCDHSQLDSNNGKQEAINQLASIVSGTLVGVDKSNQDGRNYVDMSQTFFNPTLGVAYDKPTTQPDDLFGGGYFYTGMANLLYFMMGAQYPSGSNMTTILRSIADRYYDQIVALGGANVNFAGSGFDFSTNSATFRPNDIEGSEGAAAAGAIMLWAYAKFGDAKYLNGAKWSMNYADGSSQNLFLEMLPLLTPYLEARLNATAGTDYNISKAFSAILNGSAARSGWGTESGAWGGYDVNGLLGSQTDGGGYAFAADSMGTPLFAATAKYDTRYANTVGQWLLNAANNSRFFYADQMPANRQYHGSTFISDPAHVIPYEGLRYSEGGQSPRATGDPTFYWSTWGIDSASTNLSLYSGSWAGFLGGTIAPTNVANVNRIDLNKLDFFSSTAYPEYLYYNPSTSAANVQINVGGSARELYDAVSDTVLSASVSGTQTFTIPPKSSRIIVVAPANGTPSKVGRNTVIGGAVVRYGTPTPTNLALGGVQSVSSQVNGNVASNLTDGSTSTRWESGSGDVQGFVIDLGASKPISTVDLDWETASAKSFVIKTSVDGTSWNQVYSTVAGPGGDQTVNFSPTKARYVWAYMTERGSPYAYSLWEVSVFNNDLALGAPVVASSVVNSNLAGNLTDDSSATKWESQTSSDQAFYLDLGSPQTISTVELNWAHAATSYRIDVSPDLANWTIVRPTAAGAGGDEVVRFAPVADARYVRVYMNQGNAQAGYSLTDVGVYNTDIARSAPVAVSSTANGNVAANLTDGSLATRWESSSPAEALVVVDLGSSRQVNSVLLNWETASAKTFRVDTSTDYTTWNTVFTTTSGPGGAQPVPFPVTTARYVRVYMTERNTPYTYSLWGVGVYGP